MIADSLIGLSGYFAPWKASPAVRLLPASRVGSTRSEPPLLSLPVNAYLYHWYHLVPLVILLHTPPHPLLDAQNFSNTSLCVEFTVP